MGNNMGFILVFTVFPINASFHAYAFCKNYRNTVKTNINPILLPILFGIYHSTRDFMLSSNFESKKFFAHAFSRYLSLKKFAWADKNKFKF